MSRHIAFSSFGGKQAPAPSARLDALHRVAQAARAFMQAEADPDLDRYAKRLQLELRMLDEIEAAQRS